MSPPPIEPEAAPPPRPNPVADLAPDDPYFRAEHPRHKQRVAEIQATYAGQSAPPPSAPKTLRDTLPADLLTIYDDRTLEPKDRKAAVQAVAARYEEADPEAWAEDALENPPGGLRGGLIRSADPALDAAMPMGERRAVSHVLTELAGGDPNRAQLAYFALERGGTPPEPPDGYVPRTPEQATAILQRGWGRAFERNLELAELALQMLDRRHVGEKELPSEYLRRTGFNNDPMAIRGLHDVGRRWLRRGGRPG